MASVAILIFGMVIAKMCTYIGSEDTAEMLAEVSTAFSLLVTYFMLFSFCITGGLWYLMVKTDSEAIGGVFFTVVGFMLLNLVLLIWWRAPYAALAAWKAEYEIVMD